MTLFSEADLMIDKKHYRYTIATLLGVLFQFSGKWAIAFYAACWLTAACWFSDDKNTEEEK